MKATADGSYLGSKWRNYAKSSISGLRHGARSDAQLTTKLVDYTTDDFHFTVV